MSYSKLCISWLRGRRNVNRELLVGRAEGGIGRVWAKKEDGSHDRGWGRASGGGA